MESGALETSAPPDSIVKPASMATLRRQAWAQSRDSLWQESKTEHRCPQGPQQSQSNGDTQRPSQEPGQVPNKIASWLIECGTPLGASLDDQSPSPSKGALRNGCSFEDDLSLGAEANHLQSNNSKSESRFSLAADQKRSQYKERGRSMNSTGSGKSSTVSSVSELLDLYEEDPEEILFNLGFGREEPDLNAKIPSRFFNSSSVARGIDIKVYLRAQLQRMELENPNYALTSRFRQIEVLTTVANEFFQLYSQVSGQPVQRITSKEQGGEGGEGGTGNNPSPPLKKSNSALNVAKLLKKTISKHNLLASAAESSEAEEQLNGHTGASDLTHINGHAHAGPELEGCSSDSDHKAETVSQKLTRKKDNCSLATVTEETSVDGEADQLSENSPEQSSSTTSEHQLESPELQPSNQSTEKKEGAQVVKEEKNQTTTPEKALPTLAPPQLAQLRIENADSFDMEEIQSNEDEMLPPRTSRTTDLLRTVSQQSDSSGFAEEPSADSSSYLKVCKVQESSDSCDSETTVTSHPSQDVATPVALDQPAFDLPDSGQDEAGHHHATEADATSISMGEEEHKGSLGQIPQYTAHHLPKFKAMGKHQDESRDEDPNPEPEPEATLSVSTAEQEPQPELDDTQNQSVAGQDPQQTENPTETTTDLDLPVEGESVEDKDQVEPLFLEDSISVCPPTPSSLVINALNRAKQNKLSRTGQHVNPQSSKISLSPGRGRGRHGMTRLQRSSSLPSSFHSPPRVVSSVKIHFGRGQTSCSQPRYSIKYTQEDGEDEKEEEEKGEEQEGQTSVLSTLIINPASSSGSHKKTPNVIPPKPIPCHLMRSCQSLQSCSPPPDWSPGSHTHPWSTQSVPDLSSNQRLPGQLPRPNMSTNQTQQSWNLDQTMFPNRNPSAQYFDPSPSPSPSPSFNSSPYHSTLNPHLPYPSPLHPYASLPNLFHHHNPSLTHNSNLTGHHQPVISSVPPHLSMHQPSTSTTPHHVSLGHLHPGTPTMHPQGFNHPYTHQSPYHATPHSLQFASPYLATQGYTLNPHLAFPHSPFPHPSQYPPVAPEHGLYPGLGPSAPCFLPNSASAIGPGRNIHPGLAPHAPGPGSGQGPSSTEMQLRRVLHEIRGTVQGLIECRADTPDTFSEHRAAPPSHQQSLAEFQQKRRSLNLFRSQMMDLELSIIQQQALVYNHLSPADRMEVEKLQSLRAHVREELQELEQQLEDRLMELIQNTHDRGPHSSNSVDNLSTASALRAIEPVSDLLSEQLLLQSELNYYDHSPSTNPSTRASSPVRGGGGRGGGDSEQKQGLYRTSVDITPVPPPRSNIRTEEEKEEMEGERDCREVEGGQREEPEDEGATGELGVENLQQLIREIRESLAQEVRQEIYSELLAAVIPQQPSVPARQNRA